MKDYGIITGPVAPQPIEITPNSVFIASDITPYEADLEEHHITGYQYHYKEYTKDEYLVMQAESISSLQEELAAAKILLGVE